MGHTFISPSWFFTYSIFLEIFFIIITLTLSMLSFKVYKLTAERQSKLFGISFLVISLSYIAQVFLNFLVLNKLDDDVSYLINMRDVALLNLFGMYAHALLFIIGLIILTYITFKIDSTRVFTLITAIVVLAVAFSSNKLFVFYILSAVLLLHTVVFYMSVYIKNARINTLIVLMAMMFLLLSSLMFLFSLKQGIYYVLGHILEFIAYLLILLNLIRIFQHGKKTK